ncbi:MAG: SUMF1/EgtB/PvdO family nonheme iron enzyme [Acidobacteriota bacterium]
MKECQTCRHCFPDQFNNCPTDGNELLYSIAGDTVLDGRYQLERRLGQGGMGIVYRARHIFLKTSYAIKVILPDLVGNDPMLATRFRQEAMLAARIGHRNIVNVTDFGVVGGKMPYLVMDLIKGRSLHDLLTAEKRLSVGPALEIMTALCAGVGAAHRQGIVHRDLKPLNVMLQEGVPLNEAVKVLDFGLAKIKSGELLGSFVAAQTTGMMGSPSYMAPELWSDDEPDARADIYSLGIILFQMFAGDVPFKGPSLPSIMKKHLSDLPPRFLERGVNVSPDIEAVVRRSLAKKREDRMSSVEEFIHELRVAVAAANASSARISQEVTRNIVVEPIEYADSLTVVPGSLSETSWDSMTRTDSQQRIEDEADRLNREFEEAQRRADAARLRAEEAAQKRAEEEAARRRAEEEAARKLAEEEAARRHAEEMARKREQEALERRRLEEEATRKLAEEEARQRAEEEEARKRVAEEATRLAREIVEAKGRAEEARLFAESEARKRTEEQVARQRAEEEAHRLALEVADAQRRAEEARARAEEEARKRTEVEEARREAEEEEDRLRAEESIRIQAEGEEAKKRAAEDAERLAREISEAQQRAEEAGSRAEEEARKRAEAEGARERAEEEARKLALQMEELQLRAEESRRRAEEEAAERAEIEEQRRRDEEIKRQREIEEQRRRDEELKRQREIEEKRRRDEELKRQRELEEQRRRDEEIKRQREAQVESASQANQEVREPSAALHHSAAPHQLSGTQQSAPDGGQAFANETVLSKSFGEAEASWKPSPPPFETSIPVVAPKKSYTTPIILGVIVVFIVVLMAGGAALYSRKWWGEKTPPPGPSTPGGPTTPPVSSKPDMVRIEGGTFQMGLPEVPTKSVFDLGQYPARSVNVASFWMDKTEVTNAEYADFVNGAKYAAPGYWTDGKPPANQEQWPVTNVSLADATAFAAWRSKRDSLKYRLPNEQEWEYAARNGAQGTLYPWGNEWLDGRANVEANSLKPVGSHSQGASKMGILDLIGNAWEWTSTKATPYPGNTLLVIEPGNVIIRGGAFGDKSRGADAITATRRSWIFPSNKEAVIGFRLVRD